MHALAPLASSCLQFMILLKQHRKPVFQAAANGCGIFFDMCHSSTIMLQELWLQNNQVADYVQVQSLSSVPLLTTVFLTQNPLTTALKQNYRPAVVAALVNLQVVLTAVLYVHCFGERFTSRAQTLRTSRYLATGQADMGTIAS